MSPAVALVLSLVVLLGAPAPIFSQEAPPDGPDQTPAEPQAEAEDDREAALRVSVRFMAGYVNDSSQAELGYEKQGRVGYAIVALSGATPRGNLRYLFEVNPVNEIAPRPSCGAPDFFFPNSAERIGGLACDVDGNRRVDDYRFVALDAIRQQGPIRQAYLAWHGPVELRFGRFVLPIGFGWEEAGSFSAKDATHIQRINADADFGASLSVGPAQRRLHLAAVMGDGNRFRDYTYFYFDGVDLDTNSALTMLVSGTLVPMRGVELRGAYKKGFTGSKVERLPNFYASKRNDNAIVLSARVAPVPHVAVFGEAVRYTWGLAASSAQMLGLDESPVHKNGYYVGVDVSYPVRPWLRLGMVATREELDRDDSLVKYLAEQGLYGVRLGLTERSTVWRIYGDLGRTLRLGIFRNDLSNPFPWISGIVPISGPAAFTGTGRGDDKWGFILRFVIEMGVRPRLRGDSTP